MSLDFTRPFDHNEKKEKTPKEKVSLAKGVGERLKFKSKKNPKKKNVALSVFLDDQSDKDKSEHEHDLGQYQNSDGNQQDHRQDHDRVDSENGMLATVDVGRIRRIETLSPKLREKMEKLRSRGFKVERYRDPATGDEIVFATPPNFNGSINMVALCDGARHNRNARGLLLRAEKYWDKGDAAGLVILEGSRKHRIGKKKYAALEVKGNPARLVANLNKVIGKKIKEINLQGFSRGGWALHEFLKDPQLLPIIKKVCANDSVYRRRFAKTLAKFAKMPGKELQVAYTRSTYYHANYLKNQLSESGLNVKFYNNYGSRHGDMYGKYTARFLAPTNRNGYENWA